MRSHVNRPQLAMLMAAFASSGLAVEANDRPRRQRDRPLSERAPEPRYAGVGTQPELKRRPIISQRPDLAAECINEAAAKRERKAAKLRAAIREWVDATDSPYSPADPHAARKRLRVQRAEAALRSICEG